MRTLSILFYFSIALVGFLMSVLNILAGTYNLLLVTATLCVGSLIFSVLLFHRVDCLFISTPILVVGAFLMCTYFMVSGSPEGFSTVWIVLIPAFSHLLMPRRMANCLNLALLAMVVICLWTPVYPHLNYVYTVPFQKRFPVAMGFVVICGWISELVRAQMQKRLVLITSTLKEQALTDALTHVGNRHAFEMDCEGIALPFSCAILDIDFFKHINDTFGHNAGDAVLTQLANVIRMHIRETDRLYRWGGEEFLIMLPGVGQDALGTTLERLRAEVAQCTFVYNELRLPPITISGGGVFNCVSLADVVRQADECLYQAKETGRNRMITAQYERPEFA